MERESAFDSAAAGAFGGRVAFAAASMLLLTLGSCQSINPMRTDGSVGTVGGALQPLRLPDPDSASVHLGGLALRVDSPLVSGDPGFGARFAASLRDAAGDRYRSMRGVEGKEPQFEIYITEMGESSGFDKNQMAAVLGAAAGGGAGYALGGDNRFWAAASGAAIGGILAPFLFGETQEVFAYAVEFRQRTSAEGGFGFEESSLDRGAQGFGVVDSEQAIAMAASRVQSAVQQTTFEAKTNIAREVRYFAISVKGGALTSEDERRAEARRLMLERVPSWLMGGRPIDF